jgi:hypothetical protein
MTINHPISWVGYIPIVLGSVLAASANAASITGIDTGVGLVGPGTGQFTDGSRDPAFPDNQIGFASLWDFSLVFDHPGYIDLPVLASPTLDGANEYLIFSNIENASSEPWIGFRILLGRGTGSEFTQTSGDGLDFDTPDRDSFLLDSGTVFNIVPDIYDENLLEWRGGTPMMFSPSSSSISTFKFPIDVPDITDFTIRFQPITAIPVPTTMMLWAIPAAVAVRSKRRRYGHRQPPCKSRYSAVAQPRKTVGTIYIVSNFLNTNTAGTAIGEGDIGDRIVAMWSADAPIRSTDRYIRNTWRPHESWTPLKRLGIHEPRVS